VIVSSARVSDVSDTSLAAVPPIESYTAVEWISDKAYTYIFHGLVKKILRNSILHYCYFLLHIHPVKRTLLSFLIKLTKFVPFSTIDFGKFLENGHINRQFSHTINTWSNVRYHHSFILQSSCVLYSWDPIPTSKPEIVLFALRLIYGHGF
jgi:hypothetical protein